MDETRVTLKRSQSSPGNSLSNGQVRQPHRPATTQRHDDHHLLISPDQSFSASFYTATVPETVVHFPVSKSSHSSPAQISCKPMSSSDQSHSKSWLNLSHKFSNTLSLSASWAGQAFSSKSHSNSPATVFDGDGVDVLKLIPDEVAAQLTLIDQPIFQSISESEFLSIGWNTARKKSAAPNIVNFTRRFNQISFWVIEEILMSTSHRKCSFNHIKHTHSHQSNNNNHSSSSHLMASFANNWIESNSNSNNNSPKSLRIPFSSSHPHQHQMLITSSCPSSLEWEPKTRAEVIVCFIRIARKLYDLNNLHSCYAIVSALNSAPIFRLHKSWSFVSRKEKAAFDKMTSLFNDDCNFENLRNHLAKVTLPCIPYLGMFLRDLVFVDIAHPLHRSNESSSDQRTVKMGRILQSVQKFQKTSYCLDVIPSLQDYLLSCRYIEELQKFLEDDNFKLSLRLEPPPEPRQSSHESNGKPKKSSSKFYIPSDEIEEEEATVVPAVECVNKSFTASCDAAISTEKIADPFKPSHRKARSLGSAAILETIIDQKPLRSSDGTRRKVSMQQVLNGTRRLIDDSVMEEMTEEEEVFTPSLRRSSAEFLPMIGARPNLTYDRSGKSGDYRRNGTLMSDSSSPGDQVPLIRIIENPALGDKKRKKSYESVILFEGYVRRKTLLKDGKRPAFALWVRYWLVLRSDQTLQYHPAKSLQGCSKDKFRERSSKSTLLQNGWIATPAPDDLELDSFTLSDSGHRNVYLFRTSGPEEVTRWCQSLNSFLQSLSCNNTVVKYNNVTNTGSKNMNQAVTTSPCLQFAM